MSNIDNQTPLTRKRRPGQKPTKEERAKIQEVFLQSFSLTANVRAACLKAGINRATIYEWAEHDTEFSILYKQAELDANDMIRAELFRRGVQGYEKPVISLGRVVVQDDGKPLMERIYSDSLLSLLAKARMPEFREKQQVEHSGSIDVAGAKELLMDRLRSLQDKETTE